MTTPHINAQTHDFAKTVLMPGDPLRAKYIADNYLEHAKCVTQVRNMLGYTGYYQDQAISVMGSGMGVPSISIYATELFEQFEVEHIIRVGSCGALQTNIQLHDIIIAMAASTDSAVNRQRIPQCDFAATANFTLLQLMVDAAKERAIAINVGPVFTTDLFYAANTDTQKKLQHYGLLAIEMEAAGLYGVAAQYNKKALAICSVSDHLITGEQLTAKEREQDFDKMMTLALAGCHKLT